MLYIHTIYNKDLYKIILIIRLKIGKNSYWHHSRNVQLVGDKVVGTVDLGFDIGQSEEFEEEEATDALCFMVNCVNSGFKLPIGMVL